jgi:hypothetical protein
MSEAFEKWLDNTAEKDLYYRDGEIMGSALLRAYEAGQNQRDEEVNELKRKLFTEGVKNNSNVARVEFLEDKLEAIK